ncbi:SDR family NAD(P)-dependent oxidoreductase [Amycolatopsis anabasis]|uniref:SDR family NAD(P)-dependent oxidoreductase n=1 Tax=Amycolatopsis anabasis TaxID=1840409 RepID=UPI00131C9645|nr:SDR family oxidoreductase [Amycolatopsis anabasis]
MTSTGAALVTGGSRGIGFATALALAERGWHTTIAGRDRAALREAVAKADERGLKLVPEQADVTDEHSVAELFDRLDAVDACVHCAGTNHGELLVEVDWDGVRTHSADSWERTLRLGLTGTFLVGRSAAARMVQANRGGVLVTISSAVRHGAFGQSAYSATKAGVDALTRTWALELARHDIRVVGVAPGVVDGNALRARLASEPAHERRMAALLRGVPLGRWAREQEVADAVLFAVGNDYVTGTVLEVDGGGIPDRRLN